jgi:hypothetical protein
MSSSGTNSSAYVQLVALIGVVVGGVMAASSVGVVRPYRGNTVDSSRVGRGDCSQLSQAPLRTTT